ncbi:TPA: hypothetical protein ACODKX_004653, partial [Salmonella enterica subsp. salamae serovar 42:g,t:-]
GLAVAVLPRLLRPADAHQPATLVVTVFAVKLRVVLVPALKLSAGVIVAGRPSFQSRSNT